MFHFSGALDKLFVTKVERRAIDIKALFMDTNIPSTGIGRALAKETAPPLGAHSAGASPRPDLSAITPDPAGTPSVFDWISLARAAWTWLLRPIWYMCVVFPFKFCFAMLKANARTQEQDDDYWRRRRADEYWFPRDR